MGLIKGLGFLAAQHILDSSAQGLGLRACRLSRINYVPDAGA